MSGGKKTRRKTRKRRKTRRRKTKIRKKQRGGDKANKYWGRKDFLGKYAVPNLLPKKLKNSLWFGRTLKHGIPWPWNNKK